MQQPAIFRREDRSKSDYEVADLVRESLYLFNVASKYDLLGTEADLRKDSLRPETKANQRLENWKLRRALARPYFLRSTARLSRVRNPTCFSTGRSFGS